MSVFVVPVSDAVVIVIQLNPSLVVYDPLPSDASTTVVIGRASSKRAKPSGAHHGIAGPVQPEKIPLGVKSGIPALPGTTYSPFGDSDWPVA